MNDKQKFLFDRLNKHDRDVRGAVTDLPEPKSVKKAQVTLRRFRAANVRQANRRLNKMINAKHKAREVILFGTDEKALIATKKFEQTKF